MAEEGGVAAAVGVAMVVAVDAGQSAGEGVPAEVEASGGNPEGGVGASWGMYTSI